MSTQVSSRNRLKASLLIFLSTSTTCTCFSSSTSKHTTQLQPRVPLTKTTKIIPTSSTLCMSSERKPNNPFSTFVSDLASSILSPTSTSTTINPQFNTQMSQLTSDISWKDIQTLLESNQSSTEKDFRSNLVNGYGAPSPLHKLRLFEQANSPEDVRITFYRDSASWCPYCQKVWMTLEEKRIPYRVEKVNMRCYGDKPRSFLQMQPSGNIPVAEIDGVVYNQSNDIMYALEQLFQDKKSLLANPNSKTEVQRFQMLLRLERQLFGGWMYWLTGPSGEGGKRNKDQFLQVLQMVEEELKQSNSGSSNDAKGFFLGDRVTMVDFMFAPFFERMVASLLFFKGYQIRVSPDQYDKCDFPYVNRWFDAMETLDSYRLTKSDYYTHCWDLPPQLGGCTYDEEGEPYERAINGLQNIHSGDGGSWEFPLLPHNGGVEPEWTWCNDPKEASREAVERLSYNAENIVNFASRGAGKKGMPPVMAALSDPNAVGNPSVHVSVDAVLRVICLTMLEEAHSDGQDMKRKEKEVVIQDMAKLMQKEGGMKQGVVDSLVYLRDRIGVPRDMRLPAARLLRANLNWAIGILLDV